MNGYCMRLKKCEEYEQRVQALEFVTDYLTILCYEHQADKEDPHDHYHLVIATAVELKAFRKRMVKVFDKGKGNGHMSIKPWDGRDEAFSYLFHEGSEKQILNKGHPSARIQQFRELNVKVQALVKESKKKASYLLEDEVMNDSSLNKDSSAIDIGIAIVRTALLGNKYHPNDFLLRLMVDRVRFRLCEGDVDSQDAVISSIVLRALKF